MKLKLVILAWLGLLLSASGCALVPMLQPRLLEDRPAAPAFVLQTTQGARCALGDHAGKVVAIYMTNL